jgi:CHASE2 domain-containing sensor protein
MFNNFTEIHNFLMGVSLGGIIVALRRQGWPRLGALITVTATVAALIAWTAGWQYHAWYAVVPLAAALTLDVLTDQTNTSATHN